MLQNGQIRYLEIVTLDVDGTIKIFETSGSVTFSKPIAELGNARITTLPDGSQMSIRAPMHEMEETVTRTYFLTEDIEAATAAAVKAGAELAHPVMEIPSRGKFSIFFHGGNQFGFWQD